MNHELVTWLDQQIDAAEARTRKLLYWAQQNHLAVQDPKLLGRHIPGWHDWPDVERVCRDRLADLDAMRAILADWQADLDRWNTYLDRPDTELHASFCHPDYEYETTEGQRKAWDDINVPPEGDGWERNTDAGRNGWERLDYTEESYWRRRRPDGKRDERVIPQHVRHLAAAFAGEPGYRAEWGPQ